MKTPEEIFRDEGFESHHILIPNHLVFMLMNKYAAQFKKPIELPTDSDCADITEKEYHHIPIRRRITDGAYHKGLIDMRDLIKKQIEG